MNPERVIRIGILGFGTVGQGVYKNLQQCGQALAWRVGARLEVTRASVSSLAKPRSVDTPDGFLTSDSWSIVDDPEIDLVCELIGGTTVARDLTLAAFAAGKCVITANKALICEHGAQLFAAAREHGVHYFFEASVAGGIPIIKTLREGLVANRFPRIYGILNGTSNYILTRMEREGKTFADILDDARALGYVEADEGLDLDGWDAAHKAVVLGYLAHGRWVTYPEMVVQGIRRFTQLDFQAASEFGFKIKVLAVIERDFSENALSIFVRPHMLPREHPMARVDGVFNGISLLGDVVGETFLVGRGAGPDPTSSAVISDLADAAFELQGAPPPPISEENVDVYAELARGLKMQPLDSQPGSFYLRLKVRDQPGVLADLARVLADHQVSIARLHQRDEPVGHTADLILTTHQTTEGGIRAAAKALETMPAVIEEPFVVRLFV
ncbi:MAG: homoserine dehydrogenase [Opitutales bacterium]